MDNNSIKENIRKIRKSKGLTQEEMAHRMGISLTAYRDLEKGSAGKDLALELTAKARQDFASGIGNDLGIAEALAAVYTLQRAANSAMAKKELQSEAGEIILEEFRKFNQVLGSFDVDQPSAPAEEIPQEILALAEERTAARKAKDFAKADALRDQLKALGYVVEDVPGGGIKVKKI